MLILLAALEMALDFLLGLDYILSSMDIIAPTSIIANSDCIILYAFSKPRICMMNSFFF